MVIVNTIDMIVIDVVAIAICRYKITIDMIVIVEIVIEMIKMRRLMWIWRMIMWIVMVDSVRHRHSISIRIHLVAIGWCRCLR